MCFNNETFGKTGKEENHEPMFKSKSDEYMDWLMSSTAKAQGTAPVAEPLHEIVRFKSDEYMDWLLSQ